MKKIFLKIGLTALFVIMLTNAFPQELVRVVGYYRGEFGYWGYENLSGKMIIPYKYYRAKDFSEGLTIPLLCG